MDKISTDTHAYDSKIKELYKQYVAIDNAQLQPPKSFEDSITSICNVIKTYHINLQKPPLMAVNLLVNDNKNNYDDKNDIHVHDILPRTWRFIEFYDASGKTVFLEQLCHILSGPCAQGRTTRIFQFYASHFSENDEIFNQCKLQIK